jgi:V8-like Glu-specific endopeptidase
VARPDLDPGRTVVRKPKGRRICNLYSRPLRLLSASNGFLKITLVRYIFTIVTASLLLLAFDASGYAIDGSVAQVDESDQFPFVVEILIGDGGSCSGVVLYPRIVVTNAHCVHGHETRYDLTTGNKGWVEKEEVMAPAQFKVRARYGVDSPG